MDLLSNLITSFDPQNPNFRPTELYNESWMIKLVLREASKISVSEFPIGFLPGGNWFSEALLPSAFGARYQGDPLSESRTNADGVIGQITIGKRAKADLELEKDVTQFTVVEAKVGSPLSAGTSNAKYFDQAARNVACMAEVVARSGASLSDISRLDFVVLAPQAFIEKGTFAEEISPSSIRSKVERRVAEYEGQFDEWYEETFNPTMDRIKLYSLSWEESIDWIGDSAPDVVDDISKFYDLCLKFS